MTISSRRVAEVLRQHSPFVREREVVLQPGVTEPVSHAHLAEGTRAKSRLPAEPPNRDGFKQHLRQLLINALGA